jgi:hypothetical protein
MSRNVLTPSMVSVLALLTLSPAAPAQTATTDTSRGFSIRYADGRINTRPLRPRGGMMTAIFPRIEGMETARDGLALNGLEVNHVLQGDELVVTVSLLYRTGENRGTVPVATVRVAADRPIEVSELKRYGVAPITLSIVSIPATYAFVPRGVSVSPYVDVQAAPVGPNAAAYRISITNRAPFPLMWFRFEAHRSEGSPISALKRADRDFPLIMPHAEYTFELPSGTMGQSAGDDPGAWHPVDRLELTSLMWQDGTVEGDETTAAEKAGWDRRRSTYLRAVVTILRAEHRSIAALRNDISAYRPPDVEMGQVSAGLIDQLDRLGRQQLSSDGLDFQAWLRRTIAEHELWLARIVFPKL